MRQQIVQAPPSLAQSRERKRAVIDLRHTNAHENHMILKVAFGGALWRTLQRAVPAFSRHLFRTSTGVSTQHAKACATIVRGSVLYCFRGSEGGS